MKLDFSRPNSNWTAFSAVKAYQNPFDLSQYATKAPSPHGKARQEAAVNAFVHRTWDVGANATIAIHGSSIVMAPPGGGLPNGATRFDTPASAPRIWTVKTNCARGTASTAVPLPPKHPLGKQGNSRMNLLHKAHPNPKKKAEVFSSPWLIGLSPAVLRAARTAGDSPISPKAPSDTPPSTFLGIMYL